MSNHEHLDHGRRWPAAARWAFFGFLAIALMFLLTEHRAHFFGFLPFILLAACPLLHVFHHGGHGTPPATPAPPTPPADAPSDRSHRHEH